MPSGLPAAARPPAPQLHSFTPDRELRELTRYRTSLVREQAAEVNRVQKVLEGANIKLAAVASNFQVVFPLKIRSACRHCSGW
jgi:hypothetical protein